MRKLTYVVGIFIIIGFFALPLHEVSAQQPATSGVEEEVSTGGVGPDSPLYFLDRLFESVGNVFTRGESARAERFLQLAEERLSEAGNPLASATSTQEAVERYQRQQQRALKNASTSDDADILGHVASATTRHLSALDRVEEKVPEKAKEAIRQAKENSMQGQLSALEALSRSNPNRAAQISAEAASNRLEAAREKAESGDDGNEEAARVQETVVEYQQYADFGAEISSLAEGMSSGTTTPEDIVRKASKQHMQILQDVYQKVPEEGKAGIKQAMESAQRAGNAPTQAPTPQPAPNNNRTEPGRDSSNASQQNQQQSQQSNRPAPQGSTDFNPAPADAGAESSRPTERSTATSEAQSPTSPERATSEDEMSDEVEAPQEAPPKPPTGIPTY